VPVDSRKENNRIADLITAAPTVFNDLLFETLNWNHADPDMGLYLWIEVKAR
jgi:hypothetical protein